MKDRIKLIQNQTNMSQQDFAKAIGVAPGSLSSVYSGRTQPTNNYVQGIHHAFPEININWLMFGEGEMTSSAPREAAPTLFPPSDETPAAGHPFEALVPRQEVPVVPEVPAKDFDKILREVKEIRVFYSDGTYETFLPGK